MGLLQPVVVTILVAFFAPYYFDCRVFVASAASGYVEDEESINRESSQYLPLLISIGSVPSAGRKKGTMLLEDIMVNMENGQDRDGLMDFIRNKPSDLFMLDSNNYHDEDNLEMSHDMDLSELPNIVPRAMFAPRLGRAFSRLGGDSEGNRELPNVDDGGDYNIFGKRAMFAPRLGRTSTPISGENNVEFTQVDERAMFAPLQGRSPYIDSEAKSNGFTEVHERAMFAPRLGRTTNIDFDKTRNKFTKIEQRAMFTPRLGRIPHQLTGNDVDDEFKAIDERAMFAPRLGRNSIVDSNKDNNELLQVNGRAMFAPRLGREITGNGNQFKEIVQRAMFAPRLGRASASEDGSANAIMPRAMFATGLNRQVLSVPESGQFPDELTEVVQRAMFAPRLGRSSR